MVGVGDFEQHGVILLVDDAFDHRFGRHPERQQPGFGALGDRDGDRVFAPRLSVLGRHGVLDRLGEVLLGAAGGRDGRAFRYLDGRNELGDVRAAGDRDGDRQGLLVDRRRAALLLEREGRDGGGGQFGLRLLYDRQRDGRDVGGVGEHLDVGRAFGLLVGVGVDRKAELAGLHRGLAPGGFARSGDLRRQIEVADRTAVLVREADRDRRAGGGDGELVLREDDVFDTGKRCESQRHGVGGVGVVAACGEGRRGENPHGEDSPDIAEFFHGRFFDG